MKNITVDTIPVPMMLLTFFGMLFIAMVIDEKIKNIETKK